MIRKLVIVAASGLLLSILLLSAAWVIGGPAMVQRFRHDGGWGVILDDDDTHEATTTRTLAFNPAVPLEISAPAEVHFTRGDKPVLTVSGSGRMVDAVRWEGGTLSLHEVSVFNHHGLRVEITAPALPPLRYSGAGSIHLEGIDQPQLSLDLAGAGNIEASGKVGQLSVTSEGAGNVDLSDLVASDARVRAAGVGNVDLNAGGKVNVELSGAGNVSLHHRPAELTSKVSGVGSIDQDY